MRFSIKHIFIKKLFDFSDILHAGQPINLNIFEHRNFENPSRFAQDMIFSRKLSALPQNDHFKNGQKCINNGSRTLKSKSYEETRR